MDKIFEKASRKKLRFESRKGLISVEDLWDIPLTQLDAITIAARKEFQESSEQSFIAHKSAANDCLELKFEGAKAVITIRLEEAEAKENALARAAKKAKIQEIIESKKAAGLSEMSLEDLEKLANEL